MKKIQRIILLITGILLTIPLIRIIYTDSMLFTTFPGGQLQLSWVAEEAIVYDLIILILGLSTGSELK